MSNILQIGLVAEGTTDKTLQNIINPAVQAVLGLEGKVCKNLVALIPVQMTEAWMMADINLMKRKLSTNKSNRDLGLPDRTNVIEKIANPKNTIEQALRLAYSETPKRRRRLSLSSLYSPLSQEISLEKLQQLQSYRIFVKHVKESLHHLNYL